MEQVRSEPELVALAIALGAEQVRGISKLEADLIQRAASVSSAVVAATRQLIARGGDPLGMALCSIRSAEVRRSQGATYTPPLIVKAMLRWAASAGRVFSRIVDPGVGSARFLVGAGRRFKDAKLIGIDIAPLAALIARGHLAAAGLASRSEIVGGDFRSFPSPVGSGCTLWIGNPPYVRHHLIEPEWKQWLSDTASQHGWEASRLAGLHVHFLLAAATKAKTGDLGSFICAAEWLDVNYGKLVRELFLGPMGGRTIALVEPAARPFPDAASTAAICCFDFGARVRSVKLQRVGSLTDLSDLSTGRAVRRERLQGATRWTPLTRAPRRSPGGSIELGELCRVHRGQVTGANRVWIAGPHSVGLPRSVLFPSVTKARELFGALGVLNDSRSLRDVIDLPTDLDLLDPNEKSAVEAFIKVAKRLGADTGYVAKNRKAWWSVGLRDSAPILATYMARRPPAFVVNVAEAKHINIAHGLYPREPLPAVALEALAKHLSGSVAVESGRTYSGGLTKFEPREMERLLVPDLPALLAGGMSQL